MKDAILRRPETEAAEGLVGLGFPDGRSALKNLRLLSEGPLGPRLDLVLKAAADSPSPDSALNNLERIASEVASQELLDLKDEGLQGLITICGSSPFLSGILLRTPPLFGWLFSGALLASKDFDAFRDELGQRTASAGDFDAMARELRLYKQQEFLRIGAKDLLGLSGVEEVTRELSDLASASLDVAVGFSLKSLKGSYGRPLCADEGGAHKEAGFTVIGLGKLGGRELNFSSDIDIIYIYSSDRGETAGVEGRADSRISLHAFFVKVSMMVTKLISVVTEDGIVFRVDLDLRPEGRSGDVANSLRSAEIYYESWGQSWERAAMIKARPVAGSMELGAGFLNMIRPFVWRRYLDFTAIEEIKSMKEKIDLSLLRRNPDAIDVKLGAGGIREIEFFCQALELIHAGKDPGLRERRTLKAIEKLLERGLVGGAEAGTLREGYIFLRNLEHRIQIVEGRQSQAIPAEEKELERLARMMGFRDAQGRKAGDFFWEEYKKKTSSVHDVYRSLFYKPGEDQAPEEVLILFSPDISQQEAEARLAGLGFRDPGAAYRNLSLIKSGPPFVHMSARARVLLQKLAPFFIARCSSSPDPDRALSNLERFISSIGARTTFYSLLSENPRVLDELVRLFGTSVFLSRTLIEQPESLDLLLSKEIALPYKTKGLLMNEFLGEALGAGDYESRLDALRRLKNQEVFRIGINDILGLLTPRQVSRQITFAAEACLEASYMIALDELKRLYGEPEGGRFSIIGMGKLGGRELIYGSDLDIVFVYSDDREDAVTSGPRRISSHEFFVKLGQRIISALTLRTREGFVFNVDARLRPSGSSGPLVVSKESFLNYHRGPTQVWERQALIRAREAAGDAALGRKALDEAREALFSKPLTRNDISEMLRIRRRMEAEIAREDASRYNIKTGKGGLVDIEFLAQALQLKYGADSKGLRTPYTVKALSRLSRAGVIREDDMRALKEAFSFYRLLEMRLRVVHDRPEGYLNKGSEELETLSRRAGYAGEGAGGRLLKEYEAHSEKVRSLYLKTLERLEAEAPE